MTAAATPGRELLACPCCGSASEPSTAFDGSIYEGHVVICANGKCGCQSGTFPTPAMAKRAWNTRLAAKPAESEREAVIEECAKLCETNAVVYRGTEPCKLLPSASGEPIGILFAASIRALSTMGEPKR